MKTKFNWYKPLTVDEINSVWDNAILTLDANVLLDLYRYNKSTREDIIMSIQSFQGEKWLTSQAATEFIKNRNKVIVDAKMSLENSFADLVSLKDELVSKSCSKLKQLRFVSHEIISNFDTQVTKEFDTVSESIKKFQDDYEKFLLDDNTIRIIYDIFNGSVGDPFQEDEQKSLLEEAGYRKTNKIPPGFMDAEKEGDRAYGDFFLWKQVMNKAISNKKNIILVTSERKEDWWEIYKGRTVGIRPEMLKEFRECTHRDILVYHTEQFVKHSLAKAGKELNSITVIEIQELASAETPKLCSICSMTHDTPPTQAVNSGKIIVYLHRSAYYFTVSTVLNPMMSAIPTVKAQLISHPQDEMPIDFNLTFGTGTKYDFNMHVKSREYGVMFPVGEYMFEYIAEVLVKDSLSSEDYENKDSPQISESCTEDGDRVIEK